VARLRHALAVLAGRPWVVVGAAAVLMLAVTVLAPGSLVERSDEQVFLDYAHRIGHGDYALEGGRNVELLWFGPGFPLLLAPFVALGVPIEVLRLLGPLALVLALFAFHRLLRRYVSPTAAIAATACLAFYIPLYRLLPRLYTEPLAILLVVLALLNGTRGVRDGDRWRLVVAGLCLGAFALTRVEYGMVVAVALVLCAAAALVPAWRMVALRGAAVLAVGLAVCVPWLVYTHHVTGKQFYWGNSGGLSLYWMAPSQSGDLGEPHTADEVFSDPGLAPHRPFFRSIEPLAPVKEDEALRHEAVDRIEQDPAGYGRNLAANFSRLWLRWPISRESFGPKALFYAVPGAILLVALLVALWRVVRRRARVPAELAPFLLVAAGGFAAHLLVAGYPRSIAPLVPVFVLVVTLAFARSAGAPDPDPDDVAGLGSRRDRHAAPDMQPT
jgi:4-amino-4-deoxy-L-arabinose transferase-like glycosyltransferase